MRAGLRCAVWVFVAVSGFLTGAEGQGGFALQGTVVTPEGPVAGATVLVDGARIVAVGKDVKIPDGVRVVETHGTIYPGLIDLHNHVTWNVLARWRAGQKWGARYDWQQFPEYLMALNAPHQKMVAEGHGCAAERYAEAKAVIGGATSQAGLSPADLTAAGGPGGRTGVPSNCLAGLVRELGVASRLDPAAGERLRYEVFPLGLDEASTAALRAGLQNGTVGAAMLHLAEGAATDASARREFGFLKAKGLLLPGVSLIHGVAVTPANLAEMAKAGVGLVWSPRSNFELYGSTANVAAAKQAGVKMAIAPDWSPTGSDGMLQELKYAATWNATLDEPVFTDRELFEMATQHAAALGGIGRETGTIAPGRRADLLVIDAVEADAYSLLVHSSPREVGLVVVDGEAVYGDASLMKEARRGGETVGIGVCGGMKELRVRSMAEWAGTVAELERGLGRWGGEMSGLGECR